MAPPALATVRVLHLLPHQGVGGVARSVIELVRHERMDGAPDELVLTERALDVRHDFMAPATPAHFLGLTAAPPRARGARLAELARSRGARVLHAYGLGPLLVGAAARRRLRGDAVRLVVTLTGAPPAAGFLERRRIRAALQGADVLLAPSPAVAAAWAPLGREPEVRLAAVDVQRFVPREDAPASRERVLSAPGALLVGTLAPAVPGSGTEVLLEAVERRSRAGRPTALFVVGDGPEHPGLALRARGSEVLHVRRRVQDAPAFFNGLDVFARHRSDELSPLSLLESLACARPAVIADGPRPGHGPVASLVGPEGALFTPPGDVGAVVAALDALADPADRATRAADARRRAVEHHALGRLRAELAGDYAAT